MAQPSAPPPASSNNTKFVVLGLLLLGAAVALFVLGRPTPPPAAAPAPVAVAKAPEPERANPMAEPDLELEPEPEPTPEPTPEPVKKKTGGGSTAGEWDCTGDLAGAGNVINEQRAQVRSCYERALKLNNILQGDLRLRIKVGSNGKVVASSVSGSLRDPEVFSCVKKLASQWTFTAPSGGNCAVVDVPFQFSPKS